MLLKNDKATHLTNLSDRTVIEGHNKVGEICTHQGGGLRSKLLACRGFGEAGPVHQLHIGTAWLQYPLEDVPTRYDRASRTLSQPQYDESQSDNGITVIDSCHILNEYDGFFYAIAPFCYNIVTNFSVLSIKMPLKCY